MSLYGFFIIWVFIHGIYMTYDISKYLKPGYEWHVFTGWWVFSDEGFDESGKKIRMKYVAFAVAYYLGVIYFLIE